MRAIQNYTANYPISWYWANDLHKAKTVSGAPDRYTVLTPPVVQIAVGSMSLTLPAQVALDLSVAATWDTTGGTDYTTAANRAGKDFYIYYCQLTGSPVPVIKVSANATTPTGYDASTSRKVAGFHCLCVNAGAIGGHTLTGYLAGDILPQSVWGLNHRAESENEGMVYSNKLSLWVDIYLFNGTGTSTTSINGATIKDNTVRFNYTEYAALVKKRLLWDYELIVASEGCNIGTAISGAVDAVTTSGHTDSAGRRMLSNIGMEDCSGVMYLFICNVHANQDGSDAWSWKTTSGSRGKSYTQGTSGYLSPLSTGNWAYGSGSGPVAMRLERQAWYQSTIAGSRLCSKKRG